MKLEAPRLPAAPESAGLMESVRHAREQVEDVVGRLFQGELLEHSQLGEVEFRGCIFENCRLTGAVFQRVAFTDVLFKDCDLSGRRLAAVRYPALCAAGLQGGGG